MSPGPGVCFARLRIAAEMPLSQNALCCLTVVAGFEVPGRWDLSWAGRGKHSLI